MDPRQSIEFEDLVRVLSVYSPLQARAGRTVGPRRPMPPPPLQPTLCLFARQSAGGHVDSAAGSVTRHNNNNIHVLNMVHIIYSVGTTATEG